MANPRQRLYPNLRRGAVAVKNSGETARAPRGRAFRKGASGNPRGRPKGAQNKVTREVQALAQGIIEDPVVQAKMLAQAQRGRLAPAVMVLLFHYAYGKPKETLALEKKPAVLVIRIEDAPYQGDVRASGQDIPTVAMDGGRMHQLGPAPASPVPNLQDIPTVAVR